MPLNFDRRGPAEVSQLARATLGKLSARPRGDLRGERGPIANAVVSDTSLPVYSIRLDSLVHGDTSPAQMARAEPESWRVFVMDDEGREPTGVVDIVSSQPGGAKARFLSYSQGPQVASSGQVLTDAEESVHLRSRRLQPGFLEIPGISVSAIWLKDLDGQGDAVVPIEPIPRFLSDRASYTLPEFLERVRVRAIRRLQFDNSPLIVEDAQADDEQEPGASLSYEA